MHDHVLKSVIDLNHSTNNSFLQDIPVFIYESLFGLIIKLGLKMYLLSRCLYFDRFGPQICRYPHTLYSNSHFKDYFGY